MFITQCYECGEDITFLDRQGKKIPVNAEGVVEGEKQFDTNAGHICHFDTCDRQMKEED
jgi:hypothetical protein